MEVNITLHKTITSETFVRVDLYKSIEAKDNPVYAEPNDILNCCTLVDLKEKDHIKLINNILMVIETSINVLLNDQFSSQINNSMICDYCEKEHSGYSIYYEKINGYICENCEKEIYERFKHQIT